MDDMTAFERLIANAATQAVGPPRPVDAVAVVRSAKASPEGRWSLLERWIPSGESRRPELGFSMFSALKFIAASAIVALFGGFLLAGVLTTQQGDEAAPAAMTESPSAMTTEELLSGMVTEEVEPGVLRVVNDGVRDLAYPLGNWGYSGFVMDVTPNGSVWLSSRLGSSGLFRLGEEPVFEDVDILPPYLEVAPDGSLWAIGEVSDDHRGIFSFDGEGWTLRATTMVVPHALAIGPDGTVWVVARDGKKHPGPVLLRLENDGSLTTIEDWSDVYDGDAHWLQLAVSPDGDVWLVGTQRGHPEGAELLLRFDGEGWDAIPGPEGWNPGNVGRYLDVDPDGALWVKASRTGGLARFDDPGWTTFTEADGVEPWGEASFSSGDLLNAATDGSIWLRGSPTDKGCGGVAHYHGTTWTSYLVETCIHDLAFAPDGSVWLVANAYYTGPVGLYVITPEAMTATN